MNNRYLLPTILLAITFLVRLFTVLLINKIPCMDNEYLADAIRLLDDPQRHPIGLAPSYGILLYLLNSITGSLFLASSVCYVAGSFLVSLFAYLIARAIFNEKTGLIVLGLLAFIPNLTVAIAGYSHTPVVGLAFLMCSAYILLLHNRSALPVFPCMVAFGSIASLAVFFRPENLIVVLALLIISVFNKGLKLSRRTVFIAGSAIILTLAVIGHSNFIKNNSSSDDVGLFSDARYGYRAFIHTLSLRDIGIIDEDRAMALGKVAFGSPESNEWKISAAIRKNPRQFVSNLLFNMQELLHVFGHPLYIPIYLYFFIGAALFARISSFSPYRKLPLLVFFIASLIPCLIFHVEIRYLSPSLIPVVLMSGWGIAQIDEVKSLNWLLTAVMIPTVTIFLMYLNNNMKLASLCG